MSGIVLEFTGLKSKGQMRCAVTYSKKRPAEDFDEDSAAATLLKYTPDEIEAAKGLIMLATGEPSPKRVKLTPAGPSLSERSTRATPLKSPQAPTPSRDISADPIIIKSTQAPRKKRTVDPTNPSDALLILSTPKAGSDIYNSDDEDLAGSIDKHNLLRNVRWGPSAFDFSSTDFPSEPDFQQFVPGRFERLLDGTLRDQKHKLLVKMTTKDGRRLIFRDLPPKDWNSQKAMTALNKRISQQIRRNTDVRFREEVEPYVHEERVWICENLVGGKPKGKWEAFVEAFNGKFAGKMIEGYESVRPMRTHSSLTKEIERFGEEFYKVGKVPVTKAEKARMETRAEKSTFETLVEKSKLKLKLKAKA